MGPCPGLVMKFGSPNPPELPVRLSLRTLLALRKKLKVPLRGRLVGTKQDAETFLELGPKRPGLKSEPSPNYDILRLYTIQAFQYTNKAWNCQALEVHADPNFRLQIPSKNFLTCGKFIDM